MPIKENQALTPEKKSMLIEEVQQEIKFINDAIKQKQYNQAAYVILQQNKENLQNTLDKLFAKKGIVTPSETSKALDEIDKSKRARLEKDYMFGLRKGTFFILTLAIIGIASYMIIKREKK